MGEGFNTDCCSILESADQTMMCGVTPSGDLVQKQDRHGTRAVGFLSKKSVQFS